jgi:hypothetical protein
MGRAVPAVLLGCVVAIVLLAWSVFDLRDRLERAERRLGGEPAAHVDHAVSEPAQPSGLEPRLSSVEKDLRSLREDLRTLESATESTLAPEPAAGVDPRQILAVVKGDSDRIRDRQIDYARKRWDQDRKTALDQFSIDQKLAPEQQTQIQELLDGESERLVALMRRPGALENPEQLAADWRTALRDTDDAAHGVLEPAQKRAWDAARVFERRVLWPWLPPD